MEKTLTDIAQIDNYLVILKNLSIIMIFSSLFATVLFGILGLWFEKIKKLAYQAMITYLIFIILFGIIVSIRNNYTIEDKVSNPNKSKTMEILDISECPESSCENF